jgi:hypothetical protein
MRLSGGRSSFSNGPTGCQNSEASTMDARRSAPRAKPGTTSQKAQGRPLQPRVMPAATRMHVGSGAMTSRKARHQRAMPRQAPGSATHQVARKRDASTSQNMFASRRRIKTPRSKTRQSPTTHWLLALPTHQVTVRNLQEATQVQKAREFTKHGTNMQQPKSHEQRHISSCQEARPCKSPKRAKRSRTRQVARKQDPTIRHAHQTSGAANASGHDPLNKAP